MIAARAALVGALTVIGACSTSASGPPPTLGSPPTITGPITSPTSPHTTTAPTVAPTTLPATTLPLDPSAVTLTPYVGGLTAPVDLAWRSGDPTLYIVEQEGRIVPVREGGRGEPVLDIASQLSTGGERGLLGLAFDPTMALAYVNYTDRRGDTVIAEFAVAPDGTFDPDSQRNLLTLAQPYPNHNGGDLTFGPDGYLYVGMGDGGSGGDPERRSLVLDDLMGKMLRIDPHANGDAPYSVPADNPFVGVDGARGEIWAIGLRNPWRFNFDRETGDLWIGDVGQNQWEEVDVSRAADGGGRGVNYGWSALEGTHVYNSDQSADGATPPIFEYSHDLGCSISGGTVYRGDAIPSLRGWYLFADYCSGTVWALREVPSAAPEVVVLGEAGNVTAIVDGPDGELYVLRHDTGELLRIDRA